jgi:hypothetical protein
MPKAAQMKDRISPNVRIETKDRLKQASEKTGVSVGEIIDDLVTGNLGGWVAMHGSSGGKPKPRSKAK